MPLRDKYFPDHLVLKHLQPNLETNMRPPLPRQSPFPPPQGSRRFIPRQRPRQPLLLPLPGKLRFTLRPALSQPPRPRQSSLRFTLRRLPRQPLLLLQPGQFRFTLRQLPRQLLLLPLLGKLRFILLQRLRQLPLLPLPGKLRSICRPALSQPPSPRQSSLRFTLRLRRPVPNKSKQGDRK
jgi:hypothetical protein